MQIKRTFLSSVMTAALQIFLISLSVFPKNDTLINQTFGGQFQLKRSESGELMTIAAITADSEHIYLYDMADRSIASFDIDGELIRKVNLQSIGRGEYIGDDFIVRNNEAVFLNTVDSRLEFFDLEKGLFRKSIVFPREIPLEGNQRRYKLINRIFLDNSLIWVGNSHAVFCIDESSVLQKVAARQVKKFFTGSLVMVFNSKDPVVYRSGKIEWRKKSALMPASRHSLSGKSIVILNDKLYTCIITESGFTVASIDLSEDK